MTPWNPAVWIASNWQYIIGWGTLVVFLWRLHKIVRRFEDGLGDVDMVKLNLNSVMTNHLPHLQTELESTNKNITGLRDDVKDGFQRLTDTMNVVLTRVK